jgi:hypothetical protein
MTQAVSSESDIQEEKNRQKKTSKFDNLFLDILYNLFAWLPVTIITWAFSQLDLD